MLQNEQYYKKVTVEYIKKSYRLIDTVIEEWMYEKRISNKTADFFQISNSAISKIFGLPKVHKELEKPPLRPIVASGGSKMETMAIYVDQKLKKVILHYVRNVRFKSQTDNEFFFDSNGDPPALYDVISLFVAEDGTFENFKIGRFDSSKPLGSDVSINISAITWNSDSQKIPVSVCSENCLMGHRRASMTGQPICCFICIPCAEGEITNTSDSTECLKCPDKDWPNENQDHCIPKSIEFLSYEDPLGAALASMSVFSALVSVSLFIIFYKHNDTPIVRANNHTLSYLLLLSLMVCSLCSLVFIGQPNKINCLLSQTIFGISFVLCLSCILAKTIMVVIAFRSTKLNSKLTKYVGPVIPNTVAFILTFIQLTLSSLWLAISPPFPEENMKSQMGTIILECNEGSVTAFWCMLGYLGLLAIVSFIVAFLSRNLPNSFNEARYISFSIAVFVSVWLSFIPAYLSTKGKYMVAVEIFAILSSSMGVLLCIFLPKCYIIVFHPEMNTRQYIIGKHSSQGR
ncbi:vomeronasal type-2 receptor 26-like [Protopterus annectens]|uniref:vomeronasal type-2 receptor 26-like n=1 Tax=Protopterus annectens TaxID=7888 RepID=UPI001CF97A84|nr:vomeronasal type-2 receptor 26-like [Protopterus annectens]